MRYYDIQILQAGSTTIFREYTSYPKSGNGTNQNDPGALDVMLDIYAYTFATPQGQAVVQIRGVSIADISQASNFNGCDISVFAGFQKGLPLNNPDQAGLILKGKIFQAFGNWQGTAMTLDLVIVTKGAVTAQNTNISFNWRAGTPLADALAATFRTAFPKIKQKIQVNPKLVIAHDEVGVYQALPAFAQYLKPFTAAAVGGAYAGVDLTWTPDQIVAFDGSTVGKPTQIAFQDLAGQPVWLNQLVIQFTVPMRADIQVGDYVAMPIGLFGNPNNPAGAPGAVITTSASQPQARQQSIFSGTFQIIQVHHMGIFRQADGMAWVTVFNGAVQAPAAPKGNVIIETLSFSP